LNWNGTEIRSPTGFWVFLARAVTSSAGAGCCANTGVARSIEPPRLAAASEIRNAIILTLLIAGVEGASV
jgi:hypothetical protein